MTSRGADLRALVWFGGLVLAASAPFYVAGAVAGSIPGFPSSLPWAALAFVVPATIALAVTARQGTLGDLLDQARPRPAHPGWWVAAAASFSVPTWVDAARGGPWTPPGVGVVVGLLAVYVVAAVGEELGWTAFALPRLLRLTGSPTAAALVLAAFTATWHLIPFLQTGRPTPWIAAQLLQSVAMRGAIAGLAVGSRNTLWIGVAVHALSNLAWSTSPDAGARYDAVFVATLVLPIAALCLLVGTRAARGRAAASGG